MEIANMFKFAYDCIEGLLPLNASCSGTGLNLYRGSEEIIIERFWTSGLEAHPLFSLLNVLLGLPRSLDPKFG
jgi:hypothetical protein